jgi:uncharacterized membrane protein YcaP (DUF421 family)
MLHCNPTSLLSENTMFDMQHPWWEFIVRGFVIYTVLLVMVRITGKRTVGQFTPFDLLVVMLLSEGVSNSLNAGDESLTAGLIVAATLVGLDLLIAFASTYSKRIDGVIQGHPVLIGRDGVIYRDVLKRERVPEADVETALRSADCSLEDMRMAVLEADGNINIMKKPQHA